MFNPNMSQINENSTSPLINQNESDWIAGFTYCSFLALMILCGALQYFVRTTKSNIVSASNLHFRVFQRKYFMVYFMALFGDWLQGPYIYKLYSHYGFASSQIATLYIVGFAASVFFGTGTGVIADYFGRKRMCMVFCFTYSLCCLTKLSPNFNLLLLGRLLGGISTSLLFSVFESWYVYEHVQHYGFPKEWISITFSKATFWNSVLAIVAGIIANICAEFLKFGPVAPFILAIPFFLLSCLVMYKVWAENYGTKLVTWSKMCSDGLHVIASNQLVFLLGIVQSLFESVMYIFVFLWTPVLDVGGPPLGMIFSSFMVGIMIGSSIYQLLLDRKAHAHHLLLFAVILALSSMSGCALATSYEKTNIEFAFINFLLLEVAVGMYFPAIGYLKSQYIPESFRANIMNWFRVPLNVITCFVLLWLHGRNDTNSTCVIFLFCTGMMLACVLITLKLMKGIVKFISANEQIC